MSSFIQRFSLLIVALVVALVVTALSPVGAQTGSSEPSVPSRPPPPPQAPSPSGPMARGELALERLGRGLSLVAEEYRLEAEELRQLFVADPSLAVDNDDDLLYLDPLAPGEETVVVLPLESDDGAEPTDQASPDDTEDPADAARVFELASLSGADKTIYLDFDGHTTTGTSWNSAYGTASIVSPPYDLDDSPTSWSVTELDAIADTWASVAEDFDPWNVNVTTIEPPVDDLRRSGDDDTRWGARVVFTADTFARCGCGGQAYIGAFGDPEDEPTFVHNAASDVLAEAATHQVGHLLGLAHDGSTIGTMSHRLLGPRQDESAEGDDDPDDPEGDGEDADAETDPPAPPDGVIGVDLGGVVFLGWAPNVEDDLAGYVVEWSSGAEGPFTTLATVSLNGHIDGAPVAGANHYRISAQDTSGNRSEGATVVVVAAEPPGGAADDS